MVKVKAAKKEPAEPTPPKEPSPEPTFELPKHLREYEGHPDDRKALMAWRAEHNRVAAQLELEKREYEKRKRSEARKEQERERMERMRLEEEAEAKRLKAKQEEDRKEKEHRKREAKRMEEDAAVAVRTKSLGKDRHLRTYWWGIGSIRGAVYVEDAEGEVGVYTTRAEMDELMDALHHWGVREKALKQALHRRIHTIHAEFRKRAREEEDAAENEARRAASGYPKRDRVNPEDVPRGPGGGPDVPADESGPLAAARRHMDAMCAQGEGASLARSDGTAGAVDGSGWRVFRARARGCAEKTDIAAALLDLEEALYAVQVKEFMDPEEARRDARRRTPGKRTRASRRSRRRSTTTKTTTRNSSARATRRRTSLSSSRGSYIPSGTPSSSATSGERRWKESAGRGARVRRRRPRGRRVPVPPRGVPPSALRRTRTRGRVDRSSVVVM